MTVQTGFDIRAKFKRAQQILPRGVVRQSLDQLMRTLFDSNRHGVPVTPPRV